MWRVQDYSGISCSPKLICFRPWKWHNDQPNGPMTGMLHKSNPWQSLTDDNPWIIHIPSLMVDGLFKGVLQKFDATPCSNLTHQSLKWVLNKSSPDTKCQTPCPHLAPSNLICIHLSKAHWRPIDGPRLFDHKNIDERWLFCACLTNACDDSPLRLWGLQTDQIWILFEDIFYRSCCN